VVKVGLVLAARVLAIKITIPLRRVVHTPLLWGDLSVIAAHQQDVVELLLLFQLVL
jgi:hypothetical protein